MKKELLAGTAIVGASLLMAGTAYADWPKDPKVWVSGAFDFQVGMSDQDKEGFTGAAGAMTDGPDRGFGFITNSEVRIRAKGKTDAGMKWSAKVELEVDMNVGDNPDGSDESVIDELQITFAGSWGTLVLGNEDGAEDLLHVSSEHAVKAGSGGVQGDWEDWMNADSVNSRLINDPTMQADSSDKTKITYFTPRINGLMLGISYVPDRGAAGQAPTPDDNGDAEDFWGFGASYKQKFGDFSVSLGAVGAIADQEDDGDEDVRAWALGALVGWGPWKIGGMYQDNNDSGRSTGTPNDDSTGFDIGIGYSQGPVLLGLNWMHSEVGAGAIGATGEHEQDVVTLGVTYKLGKGVVVYAEGFWVDTEQAVDPDFEFDPGDGIIPFGDRENEAFGLILGTTVKF